LGYCGQQIDNYTAAFVEADIYYEWARRETWRPFRTFIHRSSIGPCAQDFSAYKTGQQAQVSWPMVYFIRNLNTQYLAYSSSLGFGKAEHFIINIKK
jgi:hypothetical protein